jgi:oligopeptidase A
MLIDRARERIDSIAIRPRTYAGILEELDRATEDLDVAVSMVRHLEAVVTTPELRDAWNKAQPGVVAFYSSIPLNAGLWNALQEFAATAEGARLSGIRKRFLEKTIETFRRHGAELDAAGKQRLACIDIELANLTTQFSQNVVDATAAWDCGVAEEGKLAGLPASAVAAARQAAAAKGQPGWRFTLQQPSYLAVMTYLDDAAIRERVYRAYNRRAAETNASLIPRILALRREKAQLVGYADFADFATADRMARNGASAAIFLDDLHRRTEEYFARENTALHSFRRAHESAEAVIGPWDITYWAEKQRAAEYDFNEEDLRPYFPLDSVLRGLFDLVRRLYGIEVSEAPGVPVWHPEVSHYEIRDQDGTVLGTFYADWFPRESKRQGAWMDSFITGGPRAGLWRPHVGLMCGNLTAPLSSQPALLTHREVETIFHEFGHLLHHCLSRVEVRRFSGTSVAWDFVELPSQIMENWCWERESLDLFARHWQTGEPVPQALFERMRRARTFRSANAQMRQLGFATLDLALHRDYEPARDGEAVAYANRILAQFAPAPLPDDHAMVCAFTHLFADPTGYGAGYYSYKWAEVLDADAFTRFRRDGIFNAEAGRAFRECILEKGNSEEPAELFRRFLGRDPNPVALLARLGLAS